MKANAPKRKVFQDALDLLAEDPVEEKEELVNGIVLLPVDEIHPFMITHSGCIRENVWMIWYRVSGILEC